MDTLFALAVPFAGCAAMMVLCHRMMRRGTRAPASPTDTNAVARLRAEAERPRPLAHEHDIDHAEDTSR